MTTDTRSQSELAAAADAFADELTALGLKHGLLLTGPVTLALMEPEDRALFYLVDSFSTLRIGEPNPEPEEPSRG